MPLEFYLEAHGLDQLVDLINDGLPEKFHALTSGLCEVRVVCGKVGCLGDVVSRKFSILYQTYCRQLRTLVL